ncbi:hypothetical protein COR50_16040 [Chitinophaga caeni]|uniref:Uncharacterized protein n=1 Tax=Chitinophaga caeni TaxID=2029983 RepID=A0A291QX85_9BACT|nr:hypothetical protein COR50_16040 [Chitinophaga caeni]
MINKKLDYHCCPTKNALKVLEFLTWSRISAKDGIFTPAKRTVELRTVDCEGWLGHTVVERPDRAIKLVAVMAHLCPFLVLFWASKKVQETSR